MNKYQDALKEAYEMMNAADFGSAKRGCEALKVLQELVDKATPKKPEQFGNNEYCPKCHYLGHRFYKYCPYCGQALDFGDEDD